MFVQFVKLSEKACPLGLFFLSFFLLALPSACSLDEVIEPTDTEIIIIKEPEVNEEVEETEVEEGFVCFINHFEQADFPGGSAAWLRFVDKHFQLPANVGNTHSGNIYLSFIISKSGEVSDAVVIRGISPEIDAVAVEMMHQSPDWIPGKQRGIPVKSRMQVRLVVDLK